MGPSSTRAGTGAWRVSSARAVADRAGSHCRGTPFETAIGVGRVIKGWDEGLQGMCVNEKRILTIPANKAYGT